MFTLHFYSMKTKRVDFIFLLATVFALTAFVFQTGGAIEGRVVPSTKALKAYAIAGKDTSICTIINGTFQLAKLKPGNYALVIEAVEPYTHHFMKDIQVRNAETTNVGEIQLQLK